MSERFLQLLNGAPGPTWEDLQRAGLEPLAAGPPPSGPPGPGGPGGPEEPSVVEETLVGAAALVFEWGFAQLSEWMKVWARQQTVLHTWGRVVVPAGERLHLWMGHADDRADLWFNDESLNHKNLGEEGTWSITGGRVKKGANVLVVGVNNSGRGRYGVQVIAQRGSDNARIDKACLNIQGDEGPFAGRMHIYFIQIIGAAPRGP